MGVWTPRQALLQRLRRQRQRAALEEARGGRCEVEGCRARKKLEFAHVVATGLNGRGRGMTERIRDVMQHPEAYLLLCKKHHRRQEAGEVLRLRGRRG